MDLIFYCSSQMFELCHILEGCVSNPWIVTLLAIHKMYFCCPPC